LIDDEIDARDIRRRERRSNKQKAHEENEVDEVEPIATAGDMKSLLNAIPLQPIPSEGGEKQSQYPKANDLDEVGTSDSQLKARGFESMEEVEHGLASAPALEEQNDVRLPKREDGSSKCSAYPLNIFD
jgi:hypothetical protein